MSDRSFQGVVGGITLILRRVPDRQVFARRNASEWPLLASIVRISTGGIGAVRLGCVSRCHSKGGGPWVSPGSTMDSRTGRSLQRGALTGTSVQTAAAAGCRVTGDRERR